MWASHRVPIGRKRSRTRGWSRYHGREGRIRRDQPQLRLPKSQSGCIRSFSSLPPLLEGKFWSKFDARSRPRRSDPVWNPSPDYSSSHCEVPSGRWSYLNLLQTTRFLEHDTYPELCHFIETTQQQGINHYILHCRKALLNGINAKKNRAIPPLNYEWIYQYDRSLHDEEVGYWMTSPTSSSLWTEASPLLIKLSSSYRGRGRLTFCPLIASSSKGRTLNGVMFGRLLIKDPLHFQTVDSRFYHEADLRPSRASILYDYLHYLDRLQQDHRMPLSFSYND